MARQSRRYQEVLCANALLEVSPVKAPRSYTEPTERRAGHRLPNVTRGFSNTWSCPLYSQELVR